MCRLKLRLWNCLSYPQDSKTAGGNVALQICLSEWRRIAQPPLPAIKYVGLLQKNKAVAVYRNGFWLILFSSLKAAQIRIL